MQSRARNCPWLTQLSSQLSDRPPLERTGSLGSRSSLEGGNGLGSSRSIRRGSSALTRRGHTSNGTWAATQWCRVPVCGLEGWAPAWPGAQPWEHSRRCCQVPLRPLCRYCDQLAVAICPGVLVPSTTNHYTPGVPVVATCAQVRRVVFQWVGGEGQLAGDQQGKFKPCPVASPVATPGMRRSRAHP